MLTVTVKYPSDMEFGFIPRKSTTYVIFVLRVLVKKNECRMRKMGVAEKYVSVVQDVFKAGRGGFESFNYLFLPW